MSWNQSDPTPVGVNKQRRGLWRRTRCSIPWMSSIQKGGSTFRRGRIRKRGVVFGEIPCVDVV